ncbi:YcaO-like family protein [Streptomyces sp. 5-8]|uniref:YcaO-like family protein n=1 Tax=Streptomyces musisoli TaxID=2802280 RepID=A0ABS1PAK5_9ACTN|nr:YcaO-like family protein [Streptomyces musisoli]MBL1109416.1 YcaO-like family protein [Streptomyces musisoli]
MTSYRLPGTVRTRKPEETWEALQPELARLGITRVARLTGLDHVGIPVWTAVRPAARTLVTSQGKGASDLLAQISAVLEAAELWHAERTPRVDARATHRELRLPYPMGALPVKVNHPAVADIPLGWTTGRGLSTLRDVLVPVDLISREAHPARPEVFAVTSNGLACGNTRKEAVFHALLECLERDVLHRDHAAGGRYRSLVNPTSVTDPYCADLIGRFLGAGMWLEVVHVSSPYNVPVFAAYIWSEDYPIVFAGSGCHVLPEIALSRALTEAAQSRLTCIAGTRDDLDSHEGAFAAQPGMPELADLPARAWTDCTGSSMDLEPHVDRLLAQVADTVSGVTGHEPIAVDLEESQAYAAVKVIAPGMEMRITRSIPRTKKRHG